LCSQTSTEIADLGKKRVNAGLPGLHRRCCRVGKGALAPCPPPVSVDGFGGHASLCPPLLHRDPPESAQFPADIEEFLSALLADGFAIHAAELVEGLGDGIPGGGDHGGGVAMGAADRLLQDGV